MIVYFRRWSLLRPRRRSKRLRPIPLLQLAAELHSDTGRTDQIYLSAAKGAQLAVQVHFQSSARGVQLAARILFPVDIGAQLAARYLFPVDVVAQLAASVDVIQAKAV